MLEAKAFLLIVYDRKSYAFNSFTGFSVTIQEFEVSAYCLATIS